MMSDIISERSGSILRVQLNRPDKKNAMTSNMYVSLAEVFDAAAKDDQVRRVRGMSSDWSRPACRFW